MKRSIGYITIAPIKLAIMVAGKTPSPLSNDMHGARIRVELSHLRAYNKNCLVVLFTL